MLLLRPLTGDDEEVIGLFRPIDAGSVAPTAFQPPDQARAGDATAGLLLRDAARLSLRSGAAPFRSLGHISVAPRPYQFVPLTATPHSGIEESFRSLLGLLNPAFDLQGQAPGRELNRKTHRPRAGARGGEAEPTPEAFRVPCATSSVAASTPWTGTRWPSTCVRWPCGSRATTPACR